MNMQQDSILLIGYGNPGRLDDGLGPALAEEAGRRLANRWANQWASRLTVESCYQLAIEHAEQASRHDVVIFVDADMTGPAPFRWKRIEPRMTAAFSTHHVSPETVLGIAEDVFDAKCEGYLLAIRGYEFDDFDERLSMQAKANLEAAVEFIETKLETACCEAN